VRLTDKALLHPRFRSLLLDLELDLETDGIPLRLYEGARTPFRQAELYARGRSDDNKKVTRVMAWRSMHQYGLAADYVFYVNGRWSWNEPERGMWDKYQEMARALGLASLDFEKPHIQLPYSMRELQAGEYPPGGDDSWEQWLGSQIETWGTRARLVGGISNPGAPPPLDIDVRPEVDL
jgi:peptidoglycan L-alanyl-D-glutamate endopeptidase CwlK